MPKASIRSQIIIRSFVLKIAWATREADDSSVLSNLYSFVERITVRIIKNVAQRPRPKLKPDGPLESSAFTFRPSRL